jgi:hypothetical protein
MCQENTVNKLTLISVFLTHHVVSDIKIIATRLHKIFQRRSSPEDHGHNFNSYGIRVQSMCDIDINDNRSSRFANDI